MTIHKLTLPTHMPVGPVNVYLVEGDQLTLIDTGPRSAETFRVLEQEVGARGFSLSDIRRIVITHTHPDHFGLVRQIMDRSGAEIWTHPYNAGWFNDLDEEVRRRGLFTLQVFQQAGVPDVILQAMAQSSSRYGHMFEAAPASHWLHEGDTFELGGKPWQVLHTPGHASGHISFYEPRSRQMIAGDHLIKHISSNPMLEGPRVEGQPRDSALVQYLESMRRVSQFDVTVAYSGHGEEITAHRELIEQRLAFHVARADHIYSLIAERERTAYELMRELFSRLTDFEIFLGLSEVIGHLDILQKESRIVEVPQNEHFLYAKA
jgi:glyoxylase-like metal-dependent hydrolase (beta-lactamase superfamily II)